MHIPKSGGITFSRIIQRQYRRDETFRVQAPRMAESLRVFADIPQRRRSEMRLVWGHLRFGIHELIPGPSTYITLLRDPVTRVISHYGFVLRRPEHRDHDLLTTQAMTLKEYVESNVAFEVDNQQTRAIAGDFSTPIGQCSSEMLATAKANIERHFSFVGLTERFDESLLLLRQAFGWSKLHYVEVNVARRRSQRVAVPEDTLRVIEERNRIDRELYCYASDRFQRLIASIPSFGPDLERFRRVNSLYKPLGTLTYALPLRLYHRLTKTEVEPKLRPSS